MLVVLLWLLKKEVASMKRELLDNGNIWQGKDDGVCQKLQRAGRQLG